MSDLQTQLLRSLLESQTRIEAKLDQLFGALAEDDEPIEQTTLEGDDAGRERDQSRSLDNDGK